MVIAATVLTFLAVVAINDPHSRRSRTSYLLQDTSPQTGLAYDQADLVKARVKIATSGL